MKFIKSLIAVITLMGLISTMAFAVIDGFEYTVLKTGHAPIIDGDLNEWSGAPFLEITWLNDPVDLIDEEYFSTAMALYDDTYLYIAVNNLEPNPDEITTVFKNHDDSIWSDDMNEICMNPRNDSARPFFKVSVTAANVTLDSAVGGEGNAWETDLDSATKIGNDNWGLEVRVPLKAFDIAESLTGQTWDFNVNRHTVSGVNLWSSWTTIGASFNNEAGFGIFTFSEEAFAVSPEDKATTTWGALRTLILQ